MPTSQKKHSNSSPATKRDSRFASFETNPRYRLPTKGRVKTKIDKRFQRIFEDADFTATAKLDRYGRKLKSDSKKKALQDIYEPENEDPEVDDDDVIRRELDKADEGYDPARGGGFSSSESDSESENGEEAEDEGGVDVSQSTNMNRLADEQADTEVGEITKRIAVVNLDWDNIKAVDLMALFSSFVPQGGRIEKVSIYPSEFGKERMKREDIEGPPKEIFKKPSKDEDNSDFDSDDDSEDEEEKIKKDMLEEGDDQDFDSDALRSYQLDRLRYYYAVIICSDLSTAEKLYNACDGTEYLASSNFVDLRFVPDDVTFDDDPREECDSVVPNYQPTEFVTDALQHSRVKLTWDVAPDETSRRESIRKAFTGSRAELEENDFRAYLASDSEDDEGIGNDVGAEPATAGDEPKLSKKEMRARKLREALGLGSEPMAKSSRAIGPVGDMQVTFTPALMGDEKKKKEVGAEETTVEKYIRKERERKARRKEIAVAKRNGDEVDDGAEPAEPEEDLGFDDPFFTTDEPAKPSKSAERKEERRRRREEKETAAAQNAAQKAQLEKIMADGSNGQADQLEHFDMDEITRVEKKKSKKFKKKGKNQIEDHGGLQEGFEMNVDDDRFKAVFENHEFAIDPSNPKYKSTPGMKKLLEEGRKKRKTKSDDFDAPSEVSGKAKKQKIKTANDDLNSLVESIRQKAQAKKR
ncbi:putative pre-rRNA-processing protein esf1 [Rosellinia necatrix]|uniref:Putative pre-rRNA-processing protein esf1 n=1 Tax=Rosellinia necatrix TaxID=77044 RepID=A0A1S7UI29_ROSNE|nr:putative pre-rRNA-processing protein esf1 [Rosellinia necatrix]